VLLAFASATLGAVTAGAQDQRADGSRGGLFLGGGAFHYGSDVPTPWPLIEAGAALRLPLGHSFHATAQGYGSMRWAAAGSDYVHDQATYAQISQTSSDRWTMVSSRLLVGWWLSRPLAVRFGGVLGYAWLQHSESVCGDLTTSHVFGGPTAGSAYALGPRREIEIGAYLDLPAAPEATCLELANGHTWFRVDAALLADLVVQATYFF
jgi:hypothetical protein